jgi:hypothetical protein
MRLGLQKGINMNTQEKALKDLKAALAIIKEHKIEFERVWDEWFNQR